MPGLVPCSTGCYKLGDSWKPRYWLLCLENIEFMKQSFSDGFAFSAAVLSNWRALDWESGDLGSVVGSVTCPLCDLGLVTYPACASVSPLSC